MVIATGRRLMGIDNLYDKVASTYNQQQSADVLQLANYCALNLVQGLDQNQKILSLGVGDGVYFKPYQKYFPNSVFAGLDISANMLKKAKQLMKMQVYQGDIAVASDIIKQNDFNLITAHFILAYVPLELTLNQCYQLLAEDGYVSIVTNTMGSFENMYKVFQQFGQSTNPWHKLIYKYLQSVLKTVYVPQCMDDLTSRLQHQGFDVIESLTKKIPIRLDSEAQVYEFFIEGGWFVSGLNHPILPNWLLNGMSKRLIKQHITIPFEDDVEVAVVLARKTN